MNKQFTASEVRDIAWSLDGLSRQMLRAYADLLEAREKAVTMATCGYSSTVEHRASNANVVGSNPIARSNSDADRLAEALRELVVACEEHDAMVSRIIGHPAGWNAQYLNSARQALAAHPTQAQPPAASVTDAPVPVFSWQPIETAPKNNKRPLFLARFNDDGSLQSFDYDASWMSESESWEIPEVYFFWASANGNVEEPTHWAYQPAGFDKIEAALATQENPNG